MNDLFDMDTRELDKLSRFAKNSPKQFAAVTANLLTSLAFKTREYDIQEITSSMIVRSPSFVKSNIKVNKARGSRIESQIAEVYSIRRDNFSGWEEQENGTQSKKKFVPTKFSRGGNYSGSVKPSNRFNNAKRKYFKTSQFHGKTESSRFFSMLRILGSRGGGYFHLNEEFKAGSKTLPTGLYRLDSKRLHRISVNANPTSRPNKWRSRSLSRLWRENKAADMWEKSLTHIIERSGLQS